MVSALHIVVHCCYYVGNILSEQWLGSDWVGDDNGTSLHWTIRRHLSAV